MQVIVEIIHDESKQDEKLRTEVTAVAQLLKRVIEQTIADSAFLSRCGLSVVVKIR